ncbi:amylo-1,6-glucosidase [Phakopsora pachyrhizi]|uniref:Glycogen debranching enzyme n=1 Tax=Phakopsora pachyrhizi TaxID=170000 RepID=A0AAV0AQ79_PHAPC|nr:amylo-1,6-glucosidase [Phakopsora pachyrhizi]CAH7670497.1 amylo-1,6-glucosidase [Phakopsora pachyrhizi]
MVKRLKSGSKQSLKSIATPSHPSKDSLRASPQSSTTRAPTSSTSYQTSFTSPPLSATKPGGTSKAKQSSLISPSDRQGSSMKEPVTVYELTLEDDGSPSKEKAYIRLPAPVDPYLLRISIAAGSSASKAGSLLTNFPSNEGTFERARYNAHPFPADTSRPIQTDLLITKPGAFEFYVEFDGPSNERVKSRTGYFNVDPVLFAPARQAILSSGSEAPIVLPIGEGGKVIEDKQINVPLDGLVVQTVIAKWMGRLSQWPAHLDTIRDRGYNMIHFTPLQQRGESGSPYSIYDQLRFDPGLFDQAPESAEDERTQISHWLKKLRQEWGILSMTDVVWNHTANNSPWLRDHPESGYNILNSPHLEPALVVDTALLDLSSKLVEKGLPTQLNSELDLEKIMHVVEHETIPQLKLWEYYVIDLEKAEEQFAKAWSSDNLPAGSNSQSPEHVDSFEFEKACLPIGEEDWRRVTGPRKNAASKIDIPAAVRLFQRKGYSTGDPENAIEVMKRILNELNVPQYRDYDEDIKTIIQNVRNRMRYTRLDPHGPKLGAFNAKNPLIETLFTRLEITKQTEKHDPKELSLANNGWIWNANPLEDFASPKSKAYLRREVIVWGDCVKLRYGQGEDDNPFLWKHMSEYTELMARIFGGFRIDNCHSTPIHVGERLLDVARRTRPDLYVCAELFTGSEDMDTYFVSRLGINSLIREAMNGHDAKDQSRLLYNYGLGKPIGSMDTDCLTEASITTVPHDSSQTYRCEIVPLQGSKPHAFLMDCTHDNESPSRKRTARDAISTGSLVTFGYSAIGSNKGFDDLYPQLLDLVNEKRNYEKVNFDAGIGGWKRLLNHLHVEMVLNEFKEGHFHQENEYIMAHRVHPTTNFGYLLVAHTAFSGNSNDRGYISPMKLRGTKATFIQGSSLEIISNEDPSDSTTLKGLPSKLRSLDAKLAETMVKYGADCDGEFVEIVVPPHFPPGSLMLFKTWMDGLRKTETGDDKQSLEIFIRSGAVEKFEKLGIVELNVIIFREDGEERASTAGQDGSYRVPQLCQNVYCGLEGWMHHLKHIIHHNDLGHPLCAHLRDGTWAFDYVLNRLKKSETQHPKLCEPIEWFEKRINLIKEKVPPFLRPKYFALLVYSAYKASQQRVISQCSSFIKQGTAFLHSLTMTAVQMYGLVPSASLHPKESTACVAAGLPHFSSGWARTWGRDCAISCSGLFVKTGLFEPARAHLLCFCTTIKHGLMPNLLDSVRTPRYNSRDSPWFMMQLLQEYVKFSDEGEAILDVQVKRRFPSTDEWVPWDDEKAYSETITVGGVIEEILQRHAEGIHFREYNAGPAIDGQMSDHGFNIDIQVDWSTGLILGGNDKNCGTWMDKMGESQKAGNKGFPGTPRDGAPVEITGLLFSTLNWAANLAKKGVLTKKGVEATIGGKKAQVSYEEWAELIKKNFERCYWIPEDSKEDSEFVIDPGLITRRGIYKDVFGTPQERAHADYQLRPNFPIAMAVAPQLFSSSKALSALLTARENLMGPLGMRTLDPMESDYRPYYDNANDSDDWHVAKGRNYHQGPEWVWPVGYYLRAFLHFHTEASNGPRDKEDVVHQIHSLLKHHRQHIKSDAWAGLPELTNRDGSFCRDSCESQAWSTSTIIDALFEVRESYLSFDTCINYQMLTTKKKTFLYT